MNLQKMMKQAQQMQQDVADAQQRIESQEFTGKAGNGMVNVRMNGKNRLLGVQIDTSLMQPDEKEMLEDLLVAAFNDARDQVDSTTSAEMNRITGGLQLPPGMKLPF
ncbi:MAG: YbaB/EbfC family nucleoid-associated protein [Alphaproteobacteria bacterium]